MGPFILKPNTSLERQSWILDYLAGIFNLLKYAERLVRALISSMMDYCHPFLISLPEQFINDRAAGPECNCSDAE